MLTVDQHAQRRGKITASVMPEIAGVSPYRGSLAAWLRITGRHTEPEADDGNMAWGHRVERPLLDWYRDTRDVEIANFGTIEHPEHPWLLATPDAAVFGMRGLVECKSVGIGRMRDWVDGPPVYVALQAMTQIAVCGADWCDVVATIGGNAPQSWRIERDEPTIADLIDVARAFYFEHVVTDDPPPVDEKTTSKDVEGLFTTNVGGMLPAPEGADALVAAYRELSARAEEIDAAKEQARAALCAMIGTYDGMEGTGWRATWRKAASAGVDWKGLVAHLFATAPMTGVNRRALEARFTRPGARRFDLREVLKRSATEGRGVGTARQATVG